MLTPAIRAAPRTLGRHATALVTCHRTLSYSAVQLAPPLPGGTEAHGKLTTPAASTSKLAAVRTVEAPYDDASRAHFEDWVARHPIYSDEDLRAVKVVHHKIETLPDRIADWIVRFSRWGTDLVTRYRHTDPALIAAAERDAGRALTIAELRERRLAMTADEWLLRTLFLESIAGVPGMVAAILRHLRSLRLLRRDGGWIHMLLQEAENERMHLLCFMTIKQPGPLFRLIVLGAQGVFTNLLFLLYLISPRSVHRFVQRLEQEAVYTYTTIIDEIEAGRLPEWDTGRAPQIAIDYWRLPEGKQTMKDFIYAVRADESAHRFCNGTLANMQASDVNPFGLAEPPPSVQGARAEFSRDEALAWLEEQTEAARKRHAAAAAAEAEASKQSKP